MSQGQQLQHQFSNGSHLPSSIPHITANIIPLSAVLRKFSEFAYAELSHVIQIQPNDEAKKKKLLELIVYLRQEFIRLFVLTKWSKISAYDFTKLIDLLAWLREQTNHFTNVIWFTKSLNQSLLSAKLPNPDLITALEVFNNGRPTLPTHNFIEQKLSNEKILEVLQNLNMILSIKFALIEDLPQSFLNYEIKDGKLTITTDDYELQLSTLDEDSPFTMLDFKLLQSGNIPSSGPSKLKHVANETLKFNNFKELERILVNYTNTMKFYFLHHKLNELKNYKHQYHPETLSIVLSYWTTSHTFKKSYVEIGLNRSNEIIYRWFKSGQFVETYKNVEDIELFLKQITHKHAESILNNIEDLTINKSILQINEFTGLFYFKNPTPFLNSSLKKLNTEDFKNINDTLTAIRLDLRLNEISSILSVTKWIQNDLIRLNSQELRKFSSNVPSVPSSNTVLTSIGSEAFVTPKNIKFYTRREWPSNWTFILVIDTKIRTFIGTVKSVSGAWTLNNVVELNVDTIDYKNSANLISFVTKKIFTHLITSELSNAIYKVLDSGLIIIKTSSFVNIPDASSLLYLEYEIKDNLEVFIRVKGKLKEALKLNDFQIDDNGIFQIYENIDFKRGSLLTNIIAQMSKLSKIIELINYLKNENLNLISVNLDEIIFKYDNDQICTLKEDFQIELPPDNPHRVSLTSIQRYLNSQGIGKLFKYLQNSNKLVTKLNEIDNSFEVIESKLDQKVHIQVVYKNLNKFNIVYYNTFRKIFKYVDLSIEIKIIKGIYRFFISIDGPVLKQFKSDFAFNSHLVKTNTSKGKILPLINGVLCDGESLNFTLDHFHNKIIEQFQK